ncbi:MAG TPA: hypothetical protein VJ692_10485 [Nitrospiraceae bacterium]|nr:hypothetical protein [Nitrospiraceae bacterium]
MKLSVVFAPAPLTLGAGVESPPEQPAISPTVRTMAGNNHM